MLQINLQNRNRLIENKLTVTSGEEWNEVIIRKCGMDMYRLPYLKWITNSELLCSTGNAAQYDVTTEMGKEFGKEQIHVYV